MKNRVVLSFSLLVVGCSEAHVESGSPNGGFIRNIGWYPRAAAAERVAERHCRQFGKTALFNTYPAHRQVEFRCAAKPQ